MFKQQPRKGNIQKQESKDRAYWMLILDRETAKRPWLCVILINICSIPENEKKRFDKSWRQIIWVSILVVVLILAVQIMLGIKSGSPLINALIDGVRVIMILSFIVSFRKMYRLGQAIAGHANTNDCTTVATLKPVLAEYLLYLLLPRTDRESLLADLEEEYPDVCEKFGKRRADFWYWKQIVASLYPLFVTALIRLRKWAIGGGLVWLCNHLAPSLAPTLQQWIERIASR